MLENKNPRSYIVDFTKIESNSEMNKMKSDMPAKSNTTFIAYYIVDSDHFYIPVDHSFRSIE